MTVYIFPLRYNPFNLPFFFPDQTYLFGHLFAFEKHSGHKSQSFKDVMESIALFERTAEKVLC